MTSPFLPERVRHPISITVWALFAVFYLAFFLIDLRQDYIQLLAPCSGTDCNFLAISSAEVSVLESWGLSTRHYALVMTGITVLAVAVFWLLSVLILLRRASTRIRLGISLTLLVVPISAISGSAEVSAVYPGLQTLTFVLGLMGVTILFFFLYLFPNGRFVPRWSPLPLAVTILIALIALLQEDGFLSLPPLAWRAVLASILGAISLVLGLQIYRYRRVSTPIEKLQTKWVVIGLIVTMASFPVWIFFFGGAVAFTPGAGRLAASSGGWFLDLLLLIALPVTVTIAIQRYRLWDIDVIIRRTLIYGALTAALAGIYTGSVILLQRLLPAQAQLITVISTLAIAALFSPLRRWIQELIDRRFYRQKYDSERTLAAFGAQARSEVNLEQLGAALLDAVDETLQPAKTAIWLREGDFRAGAIHEDR